MIGLNPDEKRNVLTTQFPRDIPVDFDEWCFTAQLRVTEMNHRAVSSGDFGDLFGIGGYDNFIHAPESASVANRMRYQRQFVDFQQILARQAIRMPLGGYDGDDQLSPPPFFMREMTGMICPARRSTMTFESGPVESKALSTAAPIDPAQPNPIRSAFLRLI